MKKLIALSCLTLVAPYAAAQEEIADLRKMRVEDPIKHGLLIVPEPVPVPVPVKIDWHADLDAAQLAAAKSGKPILLFQLLGKLDDEFC